METIEGVHYIKLLPGFESLPFPYKTPLPAQLSVMSRAIVAMTTGKNALLESPTGTGKTLALLSSSLAFQHKARQECIVARDERRIRLAKEKEINDAKENIANEAKMKAASQEIKNLWQLQSSQLIPGQGQNEIEVSIKYPSSWWLNEDTIIGPRIFYASRTHSQLKQVVKELRRCYFYVRPNNGQKERTAAAANKPPLPPKTATAPIHLAYEAEALPISLYSESNDESDLEVMQNFGVPDIEIATTLIDVPPSPLSGLQAVMTSAVVDTPPLQSMSSDSAVPSPIAVPLSAAVPSPVAVPLSAGAPSPVAVPSSDAVPLPDDAPLSAATPSHVIVPSSDAVPLPVTVPLPDAVLPLVATNNFIEPRMVMSILGSRVQTCTNSFLNPKAVGYTRHRAVTDMQGNPFNIEEGCSLMLRNKAMSERRDRGDIASEDEQSFDAEKKAQLICKQHNGTDSLSAHLSSLRVFDIEDSVNAALDHGGCAYFANRGLLSESTIVLLPYNYIVDSGIRNALNINVESSILIIDEAHNIADACSESASLELRRLQLQKLCTEFLNLGQKPSLRTSAAFIQIYKAAYAVLKLYDALNDAVFGISQGDLSHSKITSENVGGEISGAGSGAVSQKENSSRVWSGAEACSFLSNNCQIDVNSVNRLIESVNSIEEHAKELSPFSRSRASRESMALISAMLTLFQYLFKYTDSYVMCLTFKEVAGRREKDSTLCLWCMSPAPAFNSFASKAHCTILTSGTLAPLTGFCSELETSFPIRLEAPCAVNPRTQIITHAIQKSFAPSQLVLVSLPNEFAKSGGWPFSIAARAKLVPPTASHQSVVTINKESFDAFENSLSSCDAGSSLLGTQRGRGEGDSELKYLSGIATAILSLCTRTPGGVLVLLPSYSLLRRLEDTMKNEFRIWVAEGATTESNILQLKTTSLYNALDKVKKIFSENLNSNTNPESSEPADSFAKVLEDFKLACAEEKVVPERSDLSSPTSAVLSRRRRFEPEEFVARDEKRRKMEESDDLMNDIPELKPVSDIIAYANATSNRGLTAHTRGAILFAVCRGKASEGLDFSDELCRLVVCVGIPYPPLKSVEVEQKKKFLNRKSSQKASLDSLTGEQWYTQQAFRALNQGIGRTIRHKNDFGSIALLDERYCDKFTTKNLPRWLQSSLETSTKSFSSAIQSQGRFFEHIENHLPGTAADSKTCECSCESCRINCKR